MAQSIWARQRNMAGQQQPPQQQQSPPSYTGNMQDYLGGGHLPGVWGGNSQQDLANYGQLMGNMSAQNQQNLGDYTKMMQGLMGQNPLSNWKNPYAGMMGQTFQGMQNAPTTQQSAASWLSSFLPLMQGGGAMNFGNPQLNQTQLNPNVTNFLNGQSRPNIYNAPSLGTGGAVANRIAQMQQPMGGDNAQGNAAGNQWMQGLGGLLNQPGMTQAQMDTAARGIIDPTQRALAQKQEGDLSGLSARGLGRSTAVSKVMGENAGILGDVTSRAYGDLTQQNIGLQNQNRLAALSGLGQAQGQFTGQNQSQQGLTQNWLGNQANIGLGLAGLGQQGQLATNQLNQQASNDAFGQGATRAGMGLDLYNADANRALSELEGNRGWALNTQGMQADNQYRNANMANQNLLSLLGMGAGAGQQDFSNRAALLQGLLGAGNQNLNAWQTGQGNALNLLGMRGDMANSLYGNQYGSFLNDRNFLEDMRRYNQGYQREGVMMDNQGGGFGGFLGNLAGTLTGGLIPGASGWLGNQIFGGGSPQVNTGVTNPGGYFGNNAFSLMRGR